MPHARLLLEDTAVLVTRPAARAAPLCGRIREAGGHPVVLPTIAITPVRPVAAPEPADIYIFLSPDAVEYGLPFLRAYQIAVNHKMVVAVGRATAQALSNAGIGEVKMPPDSAASSEGLLATSCLQAARIRSRRVVLICGVGGRTLLMEELHARGAQVERLEVYRRDQAKSDIDEAIRTAGGRRPDAAVISSVEGMENLACLVRAQRREWLFAVPLIVMSKRIATERQRCGFTGMAYIAPSAGDDGLIAALVEFVKAKKKEIMKN